MNTADKIKLADVIGKWYFSWKDRITDNGASHKLGFAKEDLKVKIEAAFDD